MYLYSLQHSLRLQYLATNATLGSIFLQEFEIGLDVPCSLCITESTVRYQWYFSNIPSRHLVSMSTTDKHKTTVFKVMAVKLICSLDDKVLSSSNVPTRGLQYKCHSSTSQDQAQKCMYSCTLSQTCMYVQCMFVCVGVCTTD